jgi:hypothetical protein
MLKSRAILESINMDSVGKPHKDGPVNADSTKALIHDRKQMVIWSNQLENPCPEKGERVGVSRSAPMVLEWSEEEPKSQ